MSVYPERVGQWDLLARLLKKGEVCNVHWGATSPDSIAKFKKELEDMWNRYDSCGPKTPFPHDLIQVVPATDGPTGGSGYDRMIQVKAASPSNREAKKFLKKR